jgi:hypothetical protein
LLPSRGQDASLEIVALEEARLLPLSYRDFQPWAMALSLETWPAISAASTPTPMVKATAMMLVTK